MHRLFKKQQNRLQRKGRIRAKISGTKERPRLAVHMSLQHINAQLIDDDSHHTIVSATTVGKTTNMKGKTMTEKASVVGVELAKRAKKAGITKVVFDRGGKPYHGRIKALAEAARKEGLEF